MISLTYNADNTTLEDEPERHKGGNYVPTRSLIFGFIHQNLKHPKEMFIFSRKKKKSLKPQQKKPPTHTQNHTKLSSMRIAN